MSHIHGFWAWQCTPHPKHNTKIRKRNITSNTSRSGITWLPFVLFRFNAICKIHTTSQLHTITFGLMRYAIDYGVIFWFNTIWQGKSLAALVLCWRLAKRDISVMISCQWTANIGGIILWLMHFPLQQYWLLLAHSVRNVDLHYPVQYEWKVGERRSVLKIN
jgi:hypothetical protein